MAILEVNHIEKHFGKTKVLKDVSFSMEEGKRNCDYRFLGIGKDNTFALPEFPGKTK